jgi:dGTPase
LPWSLADRSRRFHKNEGGDQRSEFERDRDRLLYSSAFQRLAGITQIVRAGEADVFHTRQQHTIKVAQVGRRLAQYLLLEQPDEAAEHGLDPEVVEAACLAHDLGHPPFGHIGEETLNELVQDANNTDGFEGNAQSFRILTKLSIRFPEFTGIDLTRATLAATLKYPWFHGSDGGIRSKKWSTYQTERADFEFAREGFGSENRSLEAEIMNWADDVAYSVHDLEDFHRCNAIPWQRIFNNGDELVENALRPGDGDERRARLKQAYGRLLELLEGAFGELLLNPYEGLPDQREQTRRLTSNLIGKYILGIRIAPSKFGEKSVVFAQDYKDEIEVLKQITMDYIISGAPLAAQQHGQRRIIKDLFGEIIANTDRHGNVPSFLPPRLRYLRKLSPTDNARFVSDCIASLSEREAVALHGRLFGLSSGSVLDPIVR